MLYLSVQYLGDLRDLFDRVGGRLDPEQGLFAFTLEEFQVGVSGMGKSDSLAKDTSLNSHDSVLFYLF